MKYIQGFLEMLAHPVTNEELNALQLEDADYYKEKHSHSVRSAQRDT